VLANSHTAWDIKTLKIDESSVAEFDPQFRYHVSTSVHPDGGIIIGTSNSLKRIAPDGSLAQQMLFCWAGAGKSLYSTGTLTAVNTSTTVNFAGGADTSGMEPGMYLFAHLDIHTAGTGKAFIGIIASINSSTQVSLVDNALFDVTARSYYARSFKPLETRVSTGVITCATTGTKVTGQGTKFSRHGLGTPSNSGEWAILRSDDMRYIGKVNTVQSDIQLTLAANAEINCNRDKYVAIDIYTERDAVLTSARDPGFLSARFANRTWYANRAKHGRQTPEGFSRLFFSDVLDAEAVDWTSDGDHLPIPTTEGPLQPIVGLVASPTALLCMKKDETFGLFGSDPSNFQVKRIAADGALSNMTIQRWKEGIVWAGYKGIWFYDGSEPFNIIEDRLVDWYQRAVELLDPETTSAWSMQYKDDYVVHIEGALPDIGPDKTANNSNTNGSPLDHLTLYINLERRACAVWTNFALRGAITSPYEESLGTLYLVNKTDTTTPWATVGGRLGKAKDLYETEGLDTIFTDVPDPANNALGPDLYIESKRYDVNNPQLKKRFKQLQMNYHLKSVTGDYVTLGNTGAGATDYANNYLSFSTLPNLNNMASVSNSKWRISRAKDSDRVWRSGFHNKRIKFNKRSQHLGFRIWQSNLTGIQHVKIGPMALGWRPMRPGRV
jgi:hypothetical protein